MLASVVGAPFLFLLTAFIKDNPGFAVWLIGILISMVGALSGAWLLFNNSKLRELKKADEDLSRLVRADLGKLSNRVSRVEIALGHTTLLAVSNQIASMQIENAEAHGEIGERLSAVESRVPTIEDLKDTVETLKEITQRLKV